MSYSRQHSFHIPVMGLSYTIDTPIKVARFGISSVLSIVEDNLVEMMRRHYYNTIGVPYIPIESDEMDYRAKRITDYLNLVNTIVEKQISNLKKEPFSPGSEIVKYFEMLPESSSLKQSYLGLESLSAADKEQQENYLRTQIIPGSIDVNIMTKVDRNVYQKDGTLVEDGSDAIAALRGYASSKLTNSSVIFSAGMNPRLYNYLESCSAFNVNDDGGFSKKVVIKVSDYRSALIQGKYLAKKGVWVSEFRIESGLNCGGHAFATEGYLLGPILEEFKTNRQQLTDSLFEIYNAAVLKKTGRTFLYPPALRVTVQGGIGTFEEDRFLLEHYNAAGTGWGTPFLLVPEATTVDDATLQLLAAAKEKDIVLSRNSPLGVRFYYLKGSSSDTEKHLRISKGRPGSPCTEKHLAFNTEFTAEPICTASHKYQQLKISSLQKLNLPEAQYKKQLEDIVAKECLCVGLSNAAALCYNETFVKKREAVNICPGPNIVNFSKVVSLQQMTDHIYGRKEIPVDPARPHMFLAELALYLNYLEEQIQEDVLMEQFDKKRKYYLGFCNNLHNGIEYYQELADTIDVAPNRFSALLSQAAQKLSAIETNYTITEKEVQPA